MNNGIQVGTFNSSSNTITWQGFYAISLQTLYAKEWQIKASFDGKFVAFAHRGASGSRLGILQNNNGTLSRVSFSAPNAYGTSVDWDVNSQWVAMGAKSGGTLCFEVGGTKTTRQSLGISGENYFRVTEVPGSFPTTINVAGRRWQVIS
jgi:hypothetical protein